TVAIATATLPSLPGPTARATATGHTEPIGAGPDGTALTFPAGSVGGVPAAAVTKGGGAVRIICTNISGGPVTPAVAPAGFQVTTLAVGQVSFGVTITSGTNFPGSGGVGAGGIAGDIRILNITSSAG